eukprot:CAMPEP_0177785682 /NCGR_PEP_ID=MMETSP0491_2-20121128/20485_1 /TAXON_ID=63592 /ORGANISM="Tetraselmis chuii, Strain PLY429" /LENGTH=31 /DNA_ID= /DNA_START= /DNA_END= /DNA_ORIENTATION=
MRNNEGLIPVIPKRRDLLESEKAMAEINRQI